MAKVRIGFGSDFVVENEIVGFKTDAPAPGATLHVVGDIKATSANITGVATYKSYSGFLDKTDKLGTSTIDLNSQQHSLSGEIIIEGEVTVSTGTTITSGPENLTVTDSFTLAGISSDRPKKGTIRFNENLGALEFYTGVEWKAVNSRVDMGNMGRGLFMAGYTNTTVKTIDYITIPTLGNSKRFGDMTAAFYLNSAFGSAIRGISGGAYPAPSTSIYEYVTIASEGNSISFGNLATNSIYGRGAASSSTRGILAGYYNQDVTMEYIEIDTLGNGKDFGDLSEGRSYPGGMNSPTRAVFAGGFLGGGSQLSRDTMDYVTIANKGNAVDFGNLTAHRIVYDGALSSNTRGVISAAVVYSPGAVNDNRTNDYITIASTGNAIEFGDTSGNQQSATATSTQIRGVFMGGMDRSSPNGSVNTIEYITIASTGNSVDFGDIDSIKRYGGGTSDSHGGLGGF